MAAGVDVIKRGFPDLRAHIDDILAEEWICSDFATMHGQLTAGDG